MDIQHPTHAGRKTVHGEVHAAIQPAQRLPVGTHSAFRPGIGTIQTGTAQGTERQLLIHRQGILSTQVDGSSQRRRTASGIAHILQIGEIRKLVAITVHLVIQGSTRTTAHSGIMETVENKLVLGIHRLHVVAPVDETQVHHGSTHPPVVVNLIFSTQIQCHAESVQSESIHVHIVHMLILALCAVWRNVVRVVILRNLALVSKALHGNLRSSLTRKRPLVCARKISLHILQIHVGSAHTQQELQLGTHSQFFVNLMGMAQRQLSVGTGTQTHIADVVILVARVLGKLKELVRKHHAEAGLLAQFDGIVSAKRLEASGKDGEVHIAHNLIVALAEPLQRIACRDVRVHEGGHTLLSRLSEHRILHHHVLVAEVTTGIHADVSQSRDRDETA